ncbi:MAG: hypothetical protein J2P22_04390 [Nocardioides sp.]|nr:hypothetical protein [Nocardioides sp.]
MLIVILGLFVIAHGLVTAVIWTIPATEDAPFDASHSWLLGDARPLSVVLGLVAALAFVIVGIGVLGHFGWWPASAVVAGVLGAVLMIVWFDRWLAVGLAISLAVAAAGVWALVQS